MQDRQHLQSRGVHQFVSELWLNPGDAPWHFVTLPEAISDEIRNRAEGRRKAFGSVRVNATIGRTTWSTSLFPDSRTQSYLLPVKKKVRADESLREDDEVTVVLDLIDLS
jgi:hypothetical protein